MTDREKIVKIIEKNGTYNGRSFSFDYYVIQPDDIADALIAANIGDVTEWKEKVECAKRILQIPTLPNGTTDISHFEYKGERIQDIARERDEYKHRAEVVERALAWLCDETMRDIRIIMYPSIGKQVRDKQELYDHCIKQAEKELGMVDIIKESEE